MSAIEREIKILNVNTKEIMDKMKMLGVETKGKYIQEIYTFDVSKVDEIFREKLNDIKGKKDDVKRKLLDLICEVQLCFTDDDKDVFDKVLGTSNLIEYIMSCENFDKLKDKRINDVMKNVNENYSKWIRLRQTGDETTITIKKIVKNNGKYDLDAVKELEINVSNIEIGKEFLKNLGYYPSLHQRKMRITYEYKNTEIVIDKWPKIPAYIEIEGNTKEEIYQVLFDLGYKEEEAKIMNTDNVYKDNGLDIYQFKDFDFSQEELYEIRDILKYNPNKI